MGKKERVSKNNKKRSQVEVQCGCEFDDGTSAAQDCLFCSEVGGC